MIKLNNKGSILAMVLWIIAVLALFSLAVSRVTWTLSYYTEWKMSKVRAYYVFHNLVERSKIDIKNGSLNDAQIGIEQEIYENDKEEGLKTKYTIYDEEAKLNINHMPENLIEELPGMSFRDGEKINEYELKPFSVLEEITLALGNITEFKIDDLRPLLTVYGSGKVNINNVSSEVLDVMGLHESLIDDIIEVRLGSDGKKGTLDDIIFDESSGIIEDLKEHAGISTTQEAEIMKLISKGLFGTTTKHYRIEASIYRYDKLIDNYSAVIGPAKNKNTITILEWHRS
ncbi:MAG: hypothetical protein HQL29_04255 [Candidatus Omnitrophica bacterium]|nr:hypothetical protein [Candidatus Omnitrophota bacterium]